MEFMQLDLLGVPKPVLQRAYKILDSLEKDGKKIIINEKQSKKQVDGQVDFFNLKL